MVVDDAEELKEGPAVQKTDAPAAETGSAAQSAEAPAHQRSPGSTDVRLEAIAAEHSKTMSSKVNSYTNRNGWMRMNRQCASATQPLDPLILERFARDKQSLFHDFVDCSESWDAVLLVERRRQISTKLSKRRWRLMNRQDFLKRYDGNEQLVDEVILPGKRRDGLCTPNPDCPGERSQDLFYGMDESTVDEEHLFQTEQEMVVEAHVGNETVSKLMSPGGQFSDSGIPLRAPDPVGIWGMTKTLQPGVQPQTPAVVAPTGGIPAEPATSSITDAAKPTNDVRQEFAKMLQNSGLSKMLQNAAAFTPGGQEEEPPAKKPRGRVPAAPKAKARQSKGGKTVTIKLADTPLLRGTALRQECLTDSAKANQMAKQMSAITGRDTFEQSFKSHEEEYDKLFHRCSVLIKSACDAINDWQPVFDDAEKLRPKMKESLDVSTDILKGIKRRLHVKGDKQA